MLVCIVEICAEVESHLAWRSEVSTEVAVEKTVL